METPQLQLFKLYIIRLGWLCPARRVATSSDGPTSTAFLVFLVGFLAEQGVLDGRAGRFGPRCRALRPTRRMTQRPARSVMTMRGAAIRKSSSVQLLLAQSGSAQRQRRLCHTRRVARPKTGRSIKTTPGRPFTWAITPRTGQPDIRLPVSRKVREMTLSRRHQPASRLRSKDDSEGATRCGKFLELLAETVGNLVPPTTALHSFASLGTKGAAKVCAHGECC